MGYALHITRAGHWTESDSQPIPLDEWKAFVAADPDMRLDRAAEAPVPDGSAIRYENDGLAVWTGYSRHGEQSNSAWFDWSDGRVVVKTPDEEIVEKMVSIARALNANVLGDDGECYPAEEGPAPRATVPRSRSEPSRPWWKRLLGMGRRAEETGQSASATAAGGSLRVGQRVSDPWGNTGIVRSLDARANHGLGEICVRYDDGREVTYSLLGHPLQAAEESS